MSVKEIEAAISELPSREVAELFAWLTKHHAELWDEQIASDLEVGKLDGLLLEIDEEYATGPVQPLSTT